jgi:predicted AAA+ superfamily ATPase
MIQLQLDPLNIIEAKALTGKTLEDYLLDGSLPGILTIEDYTVRELKLKTYMNAYLEEEIRQEAAVRQLGIFTRFLHLAAQQAGNLINLQKLSQELGVAHTTISRYFQLLEDCLIAEQIQAFHPNNSKRQLVKAPKLLMFDLGVRRLAAQEGRGFSSTHLGHLFEQWVGMELQKLTRNITAQHRLSYWRDRNGIEVDWILTLDGQHFPIEVKWTTQPHEADIKHLKIFLKDFPETQKAYLICRVPHPMKLTEKIYALPWQHLPEIIHRERL